MHRVYFWIAILAMLTWSGVVDAGRDSVSTLDETTASFATRILAVTDVVLQRHIDPPTRQQMILTGVKALYVADNRQIPGDLSSRVSDLATQVELADFLIGIRDQFLDLKDAEAILTQGMLRAVPGDATLIEAKENSINEQVINNRYVGTGIELKTNREEDLTQIKRVFYNGPAWKAGVSSLDLIIEVDGEPMISRDLAEVVEALRGESGSDVEVVVRQPNSKELRRLKMTRGRVFIPTVEGFREGSDGQWQYTLDSARDIALLRFKRIGPSTMHELRQAAAKFRRQDVHGIVIDLREGGGILHDIVMVADSLIDGGTIGHTRSLDNSIKHEAHSGDVFDGLPMAILVGNRTSAGNVFLAAALQDSHRAIVVGEPTVGESYVSSFVSIPGRDDQLSLATSVMLRADGTPLLSSRFPMLPLVEDAETSRKLPGFIMPDHIVHHLPKRESSHNDQRVDPMLVKAIEVLKTGESQTSIYRQQIESGD